jgi:hypothetical protein
MTNQLHQLTKLPRLIKSKLLSFLAVTALVLTATFLYADPGANQPEQNTLAGTWLGNPGPGVSPTLFSFMSDGRLIFSRTITTPTGPTSFELVGTGHGEWIRTGNHEFTATMFLLRSGPTVEFTGLVKVTLTFKLSRNSDQLTSAGTVSIYDADNNLLFSFPSPGSGVYNRVTAGQ